MSPFGGPFRSYHSCATNSFCWSAQTNHGTIRYRERFKNGRHTKLRTLDRTRDLLYDSGSAGSIGKPLGIVGAHGDFVFIEMAVSV